MSLRIYLRIFGYVVTLVMHVTNILYMASFQTEEVMRYPEIRAYVARQMRFFTCWTFGLQIIYASLGLVCDLLTLNNSTNKMYKLTYSLNETRNTLFSAIIWPSAFQVSTLFWPFYLYDKSLVYPDFIDRILTPMSNHIIHSAIVPVALWEIVLQPRREPKSHTKNVSTLVVYMLLYFAVLFYTFVEQRVWLYPVFGRVEGTIYFPILIVYICLLLAVHYQTQWLVTSCLWGRKINIGNRKKNID